MPVGEPVHPVQIPASGQRAGCGPGQGPPSRRRTHDEFARAGVAFRINIGAKDRAEPRWLLPLICRRGGVSHREIGAIRIGPQETVFEIAGDAAADFALAASEPDPRARHVVIERAEGSSGPAASHRPASRDQARPPQRPYAGAPKPPPHARPHQPPRAASHAPSSPRPDKPRAASHAPPPPRPHQPAKARWDEPVPPRSSEPHQPPKAGGHEPPRRRTQQPPPPRAYQPPRSPQAPRSPQRPHPRPHPHPAGKPGKHRGPR